MAPYKTADNIYLLDLTILLICVCMYMCMIVAVDKATLTNLIQLRV